MELLINNHLDTIFADTRTGVSNCGLDKAQKWNITDQMLNTNVKIKPYKNRFMPAIGATTCGISFGDRTVSVRWHIIEESCEPILAGSKASQLGVTLFKYTLEVLTPVNTFEVREKKLTSKLEDVIE